MIEDEKRFMVMSQLLPIISQIKDQTTALHRTGTSFNLNEDIVQEFRIACYQLGLASTGKGANKVVEAFMKAFSEYSKKGSPGQVNLLMYKPQFTTKVCNLTIEQKIAVKLAVEDLQMVLQKLDTPNLEAQRKEYLERRLRKVLPKSLKISSQVHDKELNGLLQKAELALK